jgi:hypothetical protein
MKVYICGPITGLDYEERKITFATAAKQIADKGHTPINPMALDHSGHDKSWQSYMKVCIKALVDCDRIYYLTSGSTDEQFVSSRGVKLEDKLAWMLGIKKLNFINDLKPIK